jgi:type I restriction enzyme R subunit
MSAGRTIIVAPPNQTPEQIARDEIDRQLAACGWVVQDHKAMNLGAALGTDQGIAVREFPLETGPVDYLLYAGGKVIGVIEAKPEGHTLKGVEIQSRKYTLGVPAQLPAWRRPPPFAYESTGAVTQFTNGLDPDARSRPVFTFHRPAELVRLVKLETQLRAALRAMPALKEKSDHGPALWKVQTEAIRNLEASLAHGRPRALIQMATGSGKTFTAANACYRLLKFAGAKRILFLVDRNNLGRQTEGEFQNFRSPYNNYQFTEEYPVQRLTRNSIEPAAKVVITTMQRLYSMLKGEEAFDESAEEGSLFESENPLVKEPLPVVYNAAIPPETFDFIVIDECHRSIYNVCRQVLEYFDAFQVGLTATPSPQTIGYFDGNVVQDYSHERAVADGVNVGYDVYRIRTRISGQGAMLEGQPGFFVPRRDRRSKALRLRELAQDLPYAAADLDRDVVAKGQIRLVVQTFRERLPTDIFPGRTEVPKTLVFAKNDLHAEDLVTAIRDEFGKGNDFCVKITSKTTGAKPEDLLQLFRNSYLPRIAVTVDMIATGTDVKAIECLLFMRNINSAGYFEQMKGRGCRVMNEGDLRQRTPDAPGKTHFVVVDAVGVFENGKTYSKPLDRQPTVPLEKILQTVAQGVVHADVTSALASRLARLAREATYAQQAEIQQLAGGLDLQQLAARLIESVDPDRTLEAARQRFKLQPGEEPTEQQLDEVEQAAQAEALKPFHEPKLREAILRIKTDLEQVIDEVTQDELLGAEFGQDARHKAESIVGDFRAFCEKHRDEIEALKILYSKPYRAGLRYRQVRELAAKLKEPPFLIDPADKKNLALTRLWKLHEIAEPESVKGRGGRQLVDLIALVRHAIHPKEPVVTVKAEVEANYQAWMAEQAKAGIAFTDEQRKWLDAIRDHIAASLRIERDELQEVTPFSQMGGLGKVHQLFGDRLEPLLAELNERLAA